MTVEELKSMTQEDLVRRVQELEEVNERLNHGLNWTKNLTISKMRLNLSL